MRRQYFFPGRPVFALASFAAAGLARENLHALRANRLLQKGLYPGVASVNGTMVLYKHPNIINREAIGSFGRAGCAAKGLRPSAYVCG
jgi:hypothetical protein